MQDEIKWAMASRSEEKLHKLRKDLAETHCKSIADVPILTAEVKDPKSLDRLVKQCDVIISTAGPFWSIGIPVVSIQSILQLLEPIICHSCSDLPTKACGTLLVHA